MVAMLSFLMSGTALGIYFVYTTLGDCFMTIAGLLQVWIWKLIVFRCIACKDGSGGSSVNELGRRFPPIRIADAKSRIYMTQYLDYINGRRAIHHRKQPLYHRNFPRTTPSREASRPFDSVSVE